MHKRWPLLALALGLLLAANLRPTYRVTVAGQVMPGRYSLRQTEDCAAAAREAAAEILPGSDTEPPLARRLTLGLGMPDGDSAALTDALLRAMPGIGVSDSVWVNGTRLGTVSDSSLLLDALRRSIQGQMPHAAVSGRLSGQLHFQRVYTRAGADTPIGDMVLLVTGMAPVVYVDSQGKLA